MKVQTGETGYSFAFYAQSGKASQLMFAHRPPLEHSEVDSSRISFPWHILHSSTHLTLLHGADPYLVPGLFFIDHRLWLLRLRVCYMWRLSAIKVSLE